MWNVTRIIEYFTTTTPLSISHFRLGRALSRILYPRLDKIIAYLWNYTFNPKSRGIFLRNAQIDGLKIVVGDMIYSDNLAAFEYNTWFAVQRASVVAFLYSGWFDQINSNFTKRENEDSFAAKAFLTHVKLFSPTFYSRHVTTQRDTL